MTAPEPADQTREGFVYEVDLATGEFSTRPADQTRADVVLSESEIAFVYDWTPEVKARRQEFAAALERIIADRLAAERAEHAAEMERAREDGRDEGYASGRDEAETRDLNYDAMTDRAEAAEAVVARVRALADEYQEAIDESSPMARDYTAMTFVVTDLRAALDGER